MKVAFEILGTAMAVQTEEDALLRLVDRMFAAFPSRDPDDASMTLLVRPVPDRAHYFDMWASYVDRERLVLENKHFDRIAMNIAVYFNSEALRRADLHTVHAGVVAHRGRAVAFPASSGSGKSTLVAACAARGFEYLSDEALCLDWATGEVVPYPKPFWLSRWSRGSLGIGEAQLTFISPRYEEAIVAPVDMGWATRAERAHLAHVVELSLGDATTMSPAPRAKTADALLRHAFYRDRAKESFALVTKAARHSNFWRLTMKDPATAADCLFQLVADSS